MLFFTFSLLYASQKMRSALFWGIAQRIVVIPYLYFGLTYRSLKMGPIGSSETSVSNYHYTLRNTAV